MSKGSPTRLRRTSRSSSLSSPPPLCPAQGWRWLAVVRHVACQTRVPIGGAAGSTPTRDCRPGFNRHETAVEQLLPQTLHPSAPLQRPPRLCIWSLQLTLLCLLPWTFSLQPHWFPRGGCIQSQGCTTTSTRRRPKAPGHLHHSLSPGSGHGLPLSSPISPTTSHHPPSRGPLCLGTGCTQGLDGLAVS